MHVTKVDTNKEIKKVLRIENKTEIDNVQKYASLRKS